MKANIKNNLKTITIVLIMLLVASCVYYGLIQQIAIARSGAEVTEESKTRTTEDKSWQDRQQKDTEAQVDGAQGNRTRVRDPKNKFDQSNPKLKELFSKIHPEQVRDDGVYVASSDLREIPSLLCSALGVTLPDWANTYVTTYDHVLGSYVHTNKTDQGKITAYLTPSDLKPVPASALNRTWIGGILDSQVWETDEDGNRTLISGELVTDNRGENGENVRDIANGDYCTVFLTDWDAEWGATPIKRFDDPAYSKTLAKFSNITEHKATPAEAWVLAEFDKNDEPDLSVIESDREYQGVPEGIYANIGGKQIIITGDGDIGTEQFIEYKNGKYYYVDIDGEGAEYYPYTYVQHAWWKVKTKGNDKQSNMVETDLAKEAEAFEAYIKEVTGQSDVESLERDENGLFKIDYQVDFTSDAKTRFNAETNKYIIGPFTLDYLRCATKQGERDKVSFCGISNSLIIGTDADGNELLDEEGNSRLKLDENYRFVYDDPEAHKNNRNEWDRDKEDDDCTDELYYPYPAPNEEFYIEIDYLDDLSLIKNIKFNFQYMTSGGEYEFCDGTFLRIKWVFNWDMDMETRPGQNSDGNRSTSANVSSETNGNFVTAGSDINIDVVGATWSGGQPWTPPTGGPGGGPTITHTPGNYTFTGYDPNDTLHWYRFRYWLEPETYVSNTAQSLINVFALHLIVDIDEVELEIIPDDPWIDLRTSMGGFVWIDKDEQKDQSTSGTLGIYEEGIDKRAPENSVEVIVWKVTYDANGNEIEREKALGWMDDGEAGKRKW